MFFFKLAQEQGYQNHKMTSFQLEMEVNTDVLGKKNGSGKGSGLLMRSKTGLFKGRAPASTTICSLLEERL